MAEQDEFAADDETPKPELVKKERTDEPERPEEGGEEEEEPTYEVIDISDFTTSEGEQGYLCSVNLYIWSDGDIEVNVEVGFMEFTMPIEDFIAFAEALAATLVEVKEYLE